MAETKPRRTRKNRGATETDREAPLETSSLAAPDSQARDTSTADTAESETPDGEIKTALGASFEVEQTRNLAPSTIAKRAWHNKKKAKEQAAQAALTLLTILDGAIGLSLGPECQLTPDERQMIEAPLTRIMARLAPETTEAIDRWTDPILLAFGVATWGARVFFVLQRQASEAQPSKPATTQTPEAQPTITRAGPAGSGDGNLPTEIAKLFGE